MLPEGTGPEAGHSGRDTGRRTDRRLSCDVGAFITRRGFGGILYYNYNKEPLKPCSNYYGPYSALSSTSKGPCTYIA